MVLFDGIRTNTLHAGCYDFAVYSNRVYAIQQAAGAGREVVVCEDATLDTPVWMTVGLQDTPTNATSLALMDDMLYVGTESGELYAAPLPGSTSSVALAAGSVAGLWRAA